MQVAGGERSVLPKLRLFIFLFSSVVLTGVDETKATANEISGGVLKGLLPMLKGG